MPAREASVVATVKRRLKKVPGCHVEKFTKLDLFICVMGRLLVVEMKRPGAAAAAKPHQHHRLRRWAKAGAVVAVCDSADQVQALVAGIIERAGA